MSYNSPYSGAQVDDAVDKRHTQNTDTKLDEGGANETTAADVRSHIDATDNPHGVTKDQVGLGSVDNVSAADLRDRSTHTGTQTLSTISDAGTIASQDANSVNIDGGNIDGTPIGVSSASSGAFTTLTASDDVNFDSGTLFVDASANAVGIGTTSPGASLNVVEADFAKIPKFVRTTSSTNTALGACRIKATTSGNMVNEFGAGITFSIEDDAGTENDIAGINGIKSGADNDGALTFQTFTAGTRTERMRIDSSGKVGIGTTSPTQKLDVNVASGTNFVRAGSGSLANTEQTGFLAQAPGRVQSYSVYKHAGIGNACGYIGLVCEDGNSNLLWVDNSDILRISGNSDHVGTTSGTVVGTQTSDERMKNIEGSAPYGLFEILQLKPVKYALKTEPDTPRLGFTAQQVRDIIPESVFDTDEDMGEGQPTRLGMEYVQIIPVLVNAIKELKAELDELKGSQ